MSISDLTATFMALDPSVKAGIVTVVIATVTFIIRRYVLSNNNIVWGSLNGYWYQIPKTDGPSSSLISHLFFISNEGIETAENVEVLLNFTPTHFEVWPPVKHDVETMDNNRPLIKIGRLVKDETIRIAILNTDIAPPDVLYVRSSLGLARFVQMEIGRAKSALRSAIENLLLGLGSMALLYLALRGMQLITS